MERFGTKVAIVTGGGSGIGQALCLELASRGSTVIVADINTENAEKRPMPLLSGADWHIPGASMALMKTT